MKHQDLYCSSKNNSQLKFQTTRLIRTINYQKWAIKLLLFFALLFGNYSYAQGWNYIGGPEGTYPNDVIFTKTGELICSTFQGIFTSDNLGQTWQNYIPDKTIGTIFNLTEQADGNILGVAEEGIVLSSDTGQNWTLISSFQRPNDWGARIYESPKDSSLYFAAFNKFYKSSDKGYTWQTLLDSVIIDGCAIDDSGYIYILKRYDNIYISKNSGESFEVYPVNYSMAGKLTGHLYVNNYGGVYFMSYDWPDYIVHCENGRVTQIQGGNFSNPLGLTQDGNLIFKLGNGIALLNHMTEQYQTLSSPSFVKDQQNKNIITYGSIWVANFTTEGLNLSTDSGMTWTNIDQGLGHWDCISLEITDNDSIFAGVFTGYFWGALYKSHDDGNSWWRIVPIQNDSYFTNISTLPKDNNNLIASGIQGLYLSDAEGLKWNLTLGSQIFYVSNNGAIYAAPSGQIKVSYDNGKSWQLSMNGITSSYFTGFGESRTGRIFVGIYGGLYYTDNSIDWHFITSAPFKYSQVNSFGYLGDTIYAGTWNGIYYSSDNGINWNYLNGSDVSKFLTSPQGDLLALTSGNGIKVSIDSGKSWSSLNTNIENRTVYDIEFDKYGRLYAGTDIGIFRNDYFMTSPHVMYPANGADNQPQNILFSWSKVKFADSYCLQVSKDRSFTQIIFEDSTITDTSRMVANLESLTTYYWRIKSNVTTGATNFSRVYSFTTSQPETFVLRQNFPNPFNPSTNIEFDIPKSAEVAVRIYNILGQLVATIADQKFDVGTHILKWNAAGYSSGVYIVRLESEGVYLSRKIMLLK